MKFSPQSGTNLALSASIVMLAAMRLMQHGEHQDEFALWGDLLAIFLLASSAVAFNSQIKISAP